MDRLNLAKCVQHRVGKYLMGDATFADVEEWKELQQELAAGLKALNEWKGATPDEEAERLLAILMGYCVAVRDSRCVERVLQQAEQVLPKVQDLVLKCYLAVFCYLECPDEELGKVVSEEIMMLKESGRMEEVGFLERLLENIEA